jgi:hypothetical protein
LLLGNHDMLYYHLGNMYYYCTGFRGGYADAVHKLFMDNKDLFKAAWQEGNYLLTHAGVTNKWYERNKALIEETAEKFETKNLAETFNCLLHLGIGSILAQVGFIRGGDLGSVGGIWWADRTESAHDSLTGYHQIVGHTPIDRIERFGDPASDTTIRYIDVLWNSDEVYEFEI